MRIPELREQMLSMADQIAPWAFGLASVIREWERELHRRAPVRRVVSERKTPPDPDALRRYAAAYQDETYMDIATRFNCSIGRVSEALAGFRE